MTSQPVGLGYYDKKCFIIDYIFENYMILTKSHPFEYVNVYFKNATNTRNWIRSRVRQGTIHGLNSCQNIEEMYPNLLLICRRINNILFQQREFNCALNYCAKNTEWVGHSFLFSPVREMQQWCKEPFTFKLFHFKFTWKTTKLFK